MFDIKYFVATTKRELEDSLPLFFGIQNKPHLLEVFTPSSLNDQVLLDYFEYLK
jgi:2-succinyl-5-enolpyruvyl-6-hydroxy-3-cyclohexene-1-carboxylate synthase